MKVDQAHHAFIVELRHLLEEAGISPAKLVAELARRGVVASPAIQDVSSAADRLILLEAAVDLTQDSSLMLRVGQQFDIASFGIFGFALMSSANQREALRLLLRYGQVFFQPSWTAHEHEHDRGLSLRAAVSIGTAAQQQLVTELVFSNLIAGLAFVSTFAA